MSDACITRTHNDVNELLARDTNDDFTHTYNKRGDMTNDGENYKNIYDGFGRLRRILNRSNDNLVSEYWYNGVGHRKSWKYDTDVDGDVMAACGGLTYHMAYDPPR